MDLRRFKAVLILALVLIFAVLSAFCVSRRRDDERIASDYRADAAALLAENDVEVDAEIIPSAPSSVKNFYVEITDCGGEEFLTSALGEDYFASEGGVFSGGGATLRVFGSNAVYTSADVPSEQISSERAAVYCGTLLSSLGVNTEIYVLSASGESGDGGYRAEYTARLGGYEIFNSYIAVEINADSTVVEFKNLIGNFAETDGSSAVMSAESVIADLPQNPSVSLPAEIGGVRLGIRLAECASDLSASFTEPVWQIEMSGGEAFYYDARNGSVLDD